MMLAGFMSKPHTVESTTVTLFAVTTAIETIARQWVVPMTADGGLREG